MEETTSPLPKWLQHTLAIVDSISAWTYLALTMSAAIVLYIPSDFVNVNLEELRTRVGDQIFAAMMVAGTLFLTKTIRAIVGSLGRRRTPKQSFVITPRTMLAWWHETAQNDGSLVTQICIDCDVLNLKPTPLYFHRVQLKSPSVKNHKVLNANIGFFYEYSQGISAIRSGATEWVRITIAVRERIARAGKPLMATLLLTDNSGIESKFKVELRAS